MVKSDTVLFLETTALFSNSLHILNHNEMKRNADEVLATPINGSNV